MQIDEGLLVKFFTWVFGAITTMLTTLYWYIWKGDRRRLKVLEEKMASAITKPEVETIVKRVEDHFHEEHKSIVIVIDNRHEELREDIRDLRNVITGRWDGLDRRRQ